MARSSETSDRGSAPAGTVGIEQPVERLRTGGSARPIGVVLATVVVLAALIWQPWGRGTVPRADVSLTDASTSPATVAVVAAGAATPTIPTTPAPSREFEPPGFSRPRRGPEAYVSLVDNEWTVVALIAANGPVSVEEPATQHAPSAQWSPGDPLLVLQQGLNYTVDTTGGPDATCESPDRTRFRTTVQLPAGRVVYLGVTFPGMDPRATVTAQVMQRTGVALKRQPPVIVPLSGRTEGPRYTVPSTGAGGAVLFAAAPLGILPYATYRFDVETPGIAGHRYLYACVGA